MTGQDTATHCHCGKPRGTSDHCDVLEGCGCEEFEGTCSFVWTPPIAFPEGTIQKLLTAVRVNARREHFSELYEGFNDCRALRDEACDCGKAEAEDALRALGECPHPLWQGHPVLLCTECGQPEEKV